MSDLLELVRVHLGLKTDQTSACTGGPPQEVEGTPAPGWRQPRRGAGEDRMSVPRNLLWGTPVANAGFTLLETMIAMAIMMVAFGSILMVQSSSLRTSIKARQLNTVAALARNKMVESELEWEGKPFSEIQKEKGGEFPPPNQDYKWTRVISEVKFPTFNVGAGAGDTSGGAGDMLTRMGRVVTAYFSKAVREVKITITWKKGAGEQSYTIATYWIDLDAEFSINE